MTFETTLARVLDPAGIYWSYAGEDDYDPAIDQLVQLRIDVPVSDVGHAVAQMEQNGWQLAEQPDDPEDPQQRLFFRRHQNLLTDTKIAMLTDALRVVFPIKGARLWTWVIVENEI